MNQIRVQLDNESRNLAAATDDNIRLKAQVEALHSKNINLEAKASVFFVFTTVSFLKGIPRKIVENQFIKKNNICWLTRWTVVDMIVKSFYILYSVPVWNPRMQD